MNTKDVVIATMTLARNKEEKELLQGALSILADMNLPVYITDGGSGEDFLNFLKKIPQFKLLNPGKGVWNQAKNSLQAGYKSEAPFIFYTEPDKANFFEHALAPLLKGISVSEDTGIVLASRSATGFQSFPAFQQMTETTINRCCQEIIEKNMDFVYGPFLLNRALVPHLDNLPDAIQWGWRPYAFHMAKRLGYTVSAHEGDYFCPASQREDNQSERIYRMRQLVQNLEGLTLSTQVPIGQTDQLAV